jgi:phosphoglycerate dehydrogenase-like enzyme
MENLRLIIPDSDLHGRSHPALERAEVIVGYRPTVEQILLARKLKLFINPWAGVQHLLPVFEEVARSKHVHLANCHGNAPAAAQHALALLLCLANRLIPHHGWMVQGRWRTGDEDAETTFLRGRRIGLLGFGHINRRVYDLLSSWEVERHVLRRSWKGERESAVPKHLRYETADLPRFLRAIDVLVAALPLTAATKGMIAREQLEMLGESGLLVNVGRGGVVDEESLYTALRDGAIEGAAIDVWYDYRPRPDDQGRLRPYSYPFHELSNVVLSPHRASSPRGDPRRYADVVRIVRCFHEGAEIPNLVDLERGY